MSNTNSALWATGRSPARRGLHSYVVREIGLRITRGDLEPGQTLPDEGKLTEELDVSRTVIREAIKVLLAKGMVETRPRRGTTVRPLTAWNVLDPDVLSWWEVSQPGRQFFFSLTEVRRIVEPAAAALAAERATDAQRRSIEVPFAAMEAGVGDPQAYRTADLEFHVTILAACGNPFLQPVANVISAVLMSSLAITNRTPKMNRRSLPSHERILEAIRAREPERARRAMQTHLDDTWSRIQKAVGE